MDKKKLTKNILNLLLFFSLFFIIGYKMQVNASAVSIGLTVDNMVPTGNTFTIYITATKYNSGTQRFQMRIQDTSDDESDEGDRLHNAGYESRSWMELRANTPTQFVATNVSPGQHRVIITYFQGSNPEIYASTPWFYTTPPDTTAPSGNTSISPSSYWTAGNVTVTINAYDNQTGVNCIKDYLGNVIAWGGNASSATAYYNAPYNANFPFYLVDGRGNTSTVYANVWNMDRTAPSGGYSLNTTAKTKNGVTATVSASDSQSGLYGIKKYGDGNYTGASSVSQTFNTNGTYTFYLRDNAGNETPYYVPITNVWNTPKLAFTETRNADGTVTIKATAYDGENGIKNITLPNNIIVNGSTAYYTTDINSTYTFKVSDNLGDTETFNYSVTKVPPQKLVISGNSNIWTNQNVSLTATASGNGCVSIKLPNNTVTNNLLTHYDATVNGNYSFTLNINDGTTITKTVNVINIDKTAPTGSYSLSTTANTLDPVKITVSMTDTQSGTDKIKIPDGSFVTGNTASYTVYESNTYNFTLYDKCGNAILYPVHITNIVTPPKITFTQSTNADGTIGLILTGSGGQDGIKYIMKSDGTIVNGASASDVIKNNGTYHFEISDNKGTIVKYDKTFNTIPPDVTVTQDITGWTTKNVNLTIKASGRGATLTKIELPDGTSTTNNTTTFIATKSGKYEFKAYDDLGNVRDFIYSVENIDIDAPTLNYKVIYNKNSSGGVIQLNAIDTQSGFKSMTLPNETTVTTDTYNYPIDMDGIYLVTVVDNLGNTRDYHINTLVGDNEGSIANHISSGLNKVTYKLTGATEQDWTDYVDPFYIRNEGITTITARAYDNAGNYTEAVSYARLDRTAPIDGGVKITLK